MYIPDLCEILLLLLLKKNISYYALVSTKSKPVILTLIGTTDLVAERQFPSRASSVLNINPSNAIGSSLKSACKVANTDVLVEAFPAAKTRQRTSGRRFLTSGSARVRLNICNYEAGQRRHRHRRRRPGSLRGPEHRVN